MTDIEIVRPYGAYFKRDFVEIILFSFVAIIDSILVLIKEPVYEVSNLGCFSIGLSV